MTTQYSFPGLLADASHLADAWSASIAEIVDQQVAKFPQFFAPPQADDDAVVKKMSWGAFPKKLARLPAAQRHTLGEDRDQQEEYCEWIGDADGSGKLVRASFTTETLFYFDFLATHDSAALLEIYRAETGEAVEPSELTDANGAYNPRNAWNVSHALHMIQEFNTLSAAVILAAQATVARTEDQGELITNTGRLIECGISADVDRNSDPLIVTDVNELARRGAQISLKQPLGLYLERLQTEGWTTPDGSDPLDYWTITRGASGHAMRATYQTPPGCEFEIGDITINGNKITSASQIAEHLFVQLTGIATSLDTGEPALTRCRQPAVALESLDAGPRFPTRGDS